MKRFLMFLIFLMAAVIVFQQWIISEHSKTIESYEGMLHEERQHYSKKLTEYDSIMNAYFDSVMTQWDFKYK